MSRFSRRIAKLLATGGILLATGSGVFAQGFREQQPWRFRSSADLQVRLNIEATRLQLNDIGTRQVGSGGTALGLGSGALGSGLSVTNSPGNRQSSSTSTANATSGSTTYNVTIRGDGNEVNVDGYLNLDVNQDTQGMESAITNQ